jgi:hypothetical protein
MVVGGAVRNDGGRVGGVGDDSCQVVERVVDDELMKSERD